MSQLLKKPHSVVGAYRTVVQAGFVPLALARINYDGENFDTLDEWDNAANYRFTPKYEGYYLIIAQIGFTVGVPNYTYIRLTQNGAVTVAERDHDNAFLTPAVVNVAKILHLTPNDYIEVYGMYAGAMPANSISASQAATFLNVTRLG